MPVGKPTHLLLTDVPSIQRKRHQRGNSSEHVERRDREQETYEDFAEHGCLHDLMVVTY
jgi:hypothetical protein